MERPKPRFVWIIYALTLLTALGAVYLIASAFTPDIVYLSDEMYDVEALQTQAFTFIAPGTYILPSLTMKEQPIKEATLYYNGTLIPLQDIVIKSPANPPPGRVIGTYLIFDPLSSQGYARIVKSRLMGPLTFGLTERQHITIFLPVPVLKADISMSARIDPTVPPCEDLCEEPECNGG